MNYYHKEEIEAKIREIWGDGPGDCASNDFDVQVDRVDDHYEIKLSNMYSPPGLKFEYLSKLSKFFDTDKIGDEDHFNEEGCDSCDYGSSYGFTLMIHPMPEVVVKDES